MALYLSILEVSQKQAYIFGSNRLSDNYYRSALIAWITSPEYFKKVLKDEGKSFFSEADNLVYSGGGHIVLAFDDKEKAVDFNRIITKKIRESCEGIEVFVSIREYVTEDMSGKLVSASENLKRLKDSLEIKKSIRSASFHQGSFGLAPLNATTRDIVSDSMQMILSEKEKCSREFDYHGYAPALKFEDLGGDERDNKFIAVIHLDGNGMGNRIKEYYDNLEEQIKNREIKGWEEFRQKVCAYSSYIDDDFKNAFQKMVDRVAFKLSEDDEFKKQIIGTNSNFFPIRRIITSGDDMCFVTEGRIGIECAALIIKILNETRNELDRKFYTACAGVAIVHQKYPFYKAYELAEQLCSNAKKFNASLSSADNGACISSIDWHIEMGEIRDTLEDTRREYRTLDGKHLEMRPYIVSVVDISNNPKNKDYINIKKIRQKGKYRIYDDYRNAMKAINEKNQDELYGRLKELRGILKQGERAAKDYIKFHKIEKRIKKVFNTNDSYEIFYPTSDGDRSRIFDIAESLQFYISLGE